MSNKYLDIAMEKVIKQEVNAVLEDIKAEIKEWYWQADKQAIAKDSCVVDAMIDLFIRTIDAHISGEPQESDDEWDQVTMIDVDGNTHKVTFKKENNV